MLCKLPATKRFITRRVLLDSFGADNPDVLGSDTLLFLKRRTQLFTVLHRERSGVVSGHHGLFLTRQIVQLRMTGNYQSFFTGQLIAIILFNCCFYFQGTISPSTLLGEFSSALTSLCQLSPTVLSPRPSLSLCLSSDQATLGCVPPSHSYTLTPSLPHILISS